MKSLIPDRQARLDALRAIIRPIVRFCLRQSLSVQDLYQLVRVEFVEMAYEEIKKTSPKVNASRVSVMTGVYREDIKKILENRDEVTESGQNIVSRVVGYWEQDRNFLTKSKTVRILTYEGEDSEFFRLVRKVNRNINPATVLFEIVRSGIAEKTPKGLKLVKKGAVAYGDPRKTFDLVGRDIELFIRCAEENLMQLDHIGNLHIRTEYDNIYKKQLPKIRKWLVEHGKTYHKQVRDYLSQFDKDMNPLTDREQVAGEKVIVQAFSITSQVFPLDGQ